MSLFPDEFPFTKPLEISAEHTSVSVHVHDPAPTTPATASVPTPDPAPRGLSASDALIAAAVAGPSGMPSRDRRRSPRQSINARATLRIDGSSAPIRRIELQNLSMLGARFVSSDELSVGDKATLRFEVGPLRWAGLMRVVNCLSQRDGGYAIGCEFVGNELQRALAA
jgi:hypothetical protein